MFYIIETTYAGPNPDQHVDADTIGIYATPGRQNMSGEVCLEGWLGTTGDWSETAHGEYETLEEARTAIAEIFGDVREDVVTDDQDGDLIERYLPGKYAPVDSEGTYSWASDDIESDITADTTSERIAELVAEYEADANSEGLTLDSDLEDMMYRRRQELRDELQSAVEDGDYDGESADDHADSPYLQKLLDKRDELTRYNDCYQRECESFDDPQFRIYWALVQAERAGNTNIRRKNSSLYATKRNGRFLMNTRFSNGEQISLELVRTGLEQFKAIGISHPLKREIISTCQSWYRNKISTARETSLSTKQELTRVSRELARLQAEQARLEEQFTRQSKAENEYVSRLEENLAHEIARLESM